MNINTALENFLQAGEANGLKAKTRTWYHDILKDFKWIFGAMPIDSIMPDTMRQYVIQVRRNARSEVTAIDKINALFAFWRWCSDEYQVVNPMARIKRPRRPKPTVKAPTIEHVRALAKACGRTGMGVRDLAMLMLVVDTGLRIGEVLALALTDIDFHNHQIHVVRGKRDKSRYVPFTRDLELVLIRWLKRRPTKSDLVFVGGGGERLKYSGAKMILRRMHQRANLEKFFSWHKFRHFSAQQYRRQGGDVFDLQMILGHSDIRTTVEDYANFVPDELIGKHERYSAINAIREDKGI